MAQNENYSQVDLRVGTEEQFNAKVGTLPAGTLFGTTDSTVSKADLSTDLKNEINGKINKPANPTSDSAVVINSSGEISTKPLTSITGKAEVAVSSTTPLNDEILWINPDGTGGGGSSSGGGKLYKHTFRFSIYSSNTIYMLADWYSTTKSTSYTSLNEIITDIGEFALNCYDDFENNSLGVLTGTVVLHPSQGGSVVCSIRYYENPGAEVRKTAMETCTFVNDAVTEL